MQSPLEKGWLNLRQLVALVTQFVLFTGYELLFFDANHVVACSEEEELHHASKSARNSISRNGISRNSISRNSRYVLDRVLSGISRVFQSQAGRVCRVRSAGDVSSSCCVLCGGCGAVASGPAPGGRSWRWPTA